MPGLKWQCGKLTSSPNFQPVTCWRLRSNRRRKGAEGPGETGAPAGKVEEA